jgi:hypothetical protein
MIIMNKDISLIPAERIEKSIYFIRGEKVMLDSDLAVLYDVETRILIQAAKRNPKRFPEDFMFQLNYQEVAALRSQTVISNEGRGGRRSIPYAFTEQGVAMLSSVLNSDRAIDVNVQIMRAFMRLRQFISTHKDLARKIENLEKKYNSHDTQFRVVFDAIRKLMVPPEEKKNRKIGFRRENDD